MACTVLQRNSSACAEFQNLKIGNGISTFHISVVYLSTCLQATPSPSSESNSLFLWTVLYDGYLLIFIYSHPILALATRQPWVLHVIFLLLSWRWFISTTVEIHQLKIDLIWKPFSLDRLYLSKKYDWNSEQLHLSTYMGSWIKTRMWSRHIKTLEILKIKGRLAQILRFSFPFSSHRSRYMQTYNRETFQEK